LGLPVQASAESERLSYLSDAASNTVLAEISRSRKWRSLRRDPARPGDGLAMDLAMDLAMSESVPHDAHRAASSRALVRHSLQCVIKDFGRVRTE
jgi:signal transduction protein with GAF and PtsI domain